MLRNARLINDSVCVVGARGEHHRDKPGKEVTFSNHRYIIMLRLDFCNRGVVFGTEKWAALLGGSHGNERQTHLFYF